MKKTRLVKRIIAGVLTMAMMFSMSGVVFAEDVEGDTPSVVSADGYVLIDKEVEEIEDDMILEKTLEEKTPSTRAGFSETRTARVTHTFKIKSSGEIAGKVTANGTFSSTVGENECFIDDWSYTFDEYNPSKITFLHQSEETWNNSGLGILNKYAKYELKYRSVALLAGTNRSMWVKCESDGSTFTSGDKEYN